MIDGIKYLLASIVVSSLLSCSKQECITHPDNSREAQFVVSTKADAADRTKTSLSGNQLCWVEGDRIGIYCEGRQYNRCFINTEGNSFQGYFRSRGSESYTETTSYYAYYPYEYNGSVDGTNLSSVLSNIQNAPFDSRYDFIISDPVHAKYDETNMPSLSFNMANHLFCILKVPFINNDPEKAEQVLSELTIKAEGKILAGGFSFDVSKPTSDPVFSSSISSLSDKIIVRWNTEEKLGNGVLHEVYAIVNCFSASQISVSIKTNDTVYDITSNQSIDIDKGELVELPTIDLNAVSQTNRKNRTLAYWGDSIATLTLTDHLQWLLGDDWNVICCGASGDTPFEIACRNGCIPMRIKSSFVLPGDPDKKVAIGTELYSDWNQYGEYDPGKLGVGNKSWFNDGTTSRLNNCEVQGIECMMTRDDNGMYYLQRLSSGPDISIPSSAEVKSYASTHLRDVDLLVTYMGTNGYGRRKGAIFDETIADIYKEMTKYKEHSNVYDSAIDHDHIIVGFHHRLVSGHIWWSQEYHDYFLSQFGDHFLDLRTYGNANAERLLVQTGVVNSPSMINDLDHELINQGDWPASWQTDYLTNVHPNNFGSKAIAVMVYEKMRELGYVDN